MTRIIFNDDGVEFVDLTPSSIGTYTAQQIEDIKAALLVEINLLKSRATSLENAINSLTSSSFGLSNISQDSSGIVYIDVSQPSEYLYINGYTYQNGSNEIYNGMLKLDRTSLRFTKGTNGIKLYTESDNSGADVNFNLDTWDEYSYSSLQFDIGKNSYLPSGLIFNIYRGDNSAVVNHHFLGIGNSYICGNNGNLGVGLNTAPTEKLHVLGFGRFTDGLKLGANNNQMIYGNAEPSVGSWIRGDIIFSDSPSTSGFIGWVCVADGDPGTWKTFGAISA